MFAPAQPELIDLDAPAPKYAPKVDEVRAELLQILAEARAAQSLPWSASRTALYRTIVPQMTFWLPDDEAAQLRFEFEAEMKRLDAA